MKKEVKKESFFYKYKNDSKYKAKIELFGGCLFILFLIVWINISSIFSNDNYNYIESNTVTNTIEEDKNNIINKLKNNNYEYKIEVSKVKDNIESKVTYEGKKYNNLTLVTKTYEDKIEEYYIANNNYYLKNNEVYNLTNSSKYYSFISETFMDLKSIINYINVGDLINTDYTNDGKVIKTYNVKISNISMNGSEDVITIVLTEDNVNISIDFNVDYTNLYNIYDINKVDKLNLKYNINNIEMVEEFKDIIIK